VSQPPLVLIPDRLSPPPDVEQEVLGDGVEVVVCSARNAAEISDDTWARADAVLAWHDLRFTPHVLSKLKRCRVLVRVGVGVDNVDLRAAGERGIIVCNVPDYATADVADHAMALMLALSRGLLAFSEQVRGAPAHWRWETAGALRRLAGSTLGIIGLGRIGTATALRAKAFDFRVAFYDPYVPDGFDRALGLTRCDELADLLAQADLLSIHTPLTPQTEGMAGVEFFARLRPGAIFVNTARGAIVNLDALTEALRSGRLRAAGLDVLPQEPPDPHHPLIRAWRDREPWVAHRLILTPHAAFYCHESYREMRAKAALEARRVLAGQEPRNCVNGPWLRRH
jgi:phosphoglycerate dehydrogenase-like enzyme